MRSMNRRTLLAASGAAAGLASFGSRAEDLPVRVGVLTDMTGLYADAIGPGSFLAAKMAAEDAGGKVLGRTIEILSADNQNKADIGSAIARQWYDRERVGMIVGMDNSSVALAVEQVAKDRNGIAVAIAVGTNDFTGKFCTPTAFSWNYDSYALTHGVAGSLVARGLDTWFFLTVDYAFGAALEADASDAVRKAGGKVLGSVKHPLNAGDFSAYLIAAKASGAKVVALANGGGDMTGAVKQAVEFGLQQSGQTLVPMLCTNTDIHALGLPAAQGISLMTSFTWDRNEQTRAWSKRFMARHRTAPSMDHAATYSATLHYIKAVGAAGTTDTAAVAAKMREMPVDDFYANGAKLRADGRLVHDMYLVKVKSPAASKGPWEYEEIVQTVPGDKAFRPAEEVGCPLVGKA